MSTQLKVTYAARASGPAKPSAPAQPNKALFTRSKETYIALLATAGILVHLALRLTLGVADYWVLVPLYITQALGGVPLMLDLGRKPSRALSAAWR